MHYIFEELTLTNIFLGTHPAAFRQHGLCYSLFIFYTSSDVDIVKFEYAGRIA